MKKIFYIIITLVLVSASIRSFAQCTPNPLQTAFLIPDTVTDFSPAFTYMPYSQVLYISVPTDTTFIIFPATIDSITLVSITGLPSSITYVSNPASGVFQGGSVGCIAFSGTPTFAEIGTYALTLNSLVTGNAAVIGDTTLPVAVQGYTLKVLDSASYGIYHNDPNYQFTVFQNTPNPFNDVTEIAFMSSGNENVQVEIFDILGHLVFEKSLVSIKGYNSVYFNAADYEAGIYIYKISNGNLIFSRRMSVTRN